MIDDPLGRRTFPDPLDVAPRLVQLGLTEQLLLEAVGSGAQHASSCTAHDPVMLGGLTFWGKTVRHLRDSLVPLGWRIDNTRNYPSVVHPSGEWAIGVSSGDENTGTVDREPPRTRNPKGTVTKAIADRNQLTLDIDVPQVQGAPPAPPQTTWLLLFHADHTTHEIRVELSLPKSMGLDGRVSAWYQRLILTTIPGPDKDFELEEDDDPAIDFDVDRRAQ